MHILLYIETKKGWRRIDTRSLTYARNTALKHQFRTKQQKHLIVQAVGAHKHFQLPNCNTEVNGKLLNKIPQ